MGYLDSWEVWIVAIIIILVLLCIWFRVRESGDDAGTSSCTDTITRRVEEVISMPSTPVADGTSSAVAMAETLTYTEALAPIPRALPVPPAPPALGRALPHQSRGERRCQEALESMYPGEKFLTQVRMDALENPETGRNLELDIYCPALKLALEYDGRQHAEVVPRFHPNGEADLKAQQKRDALKDELCKKAGIFLIRVPHTVPFAQIEDYIRYRLPENVEARDRQLALRTRTR